MSRGSTLSSAKANDFGLASGSFKFRFLKAAFCLFLDVWKWGTHFLCLELFGAYLLVCSWLFILFYGTKVCLEIEMTFLAPQKTHSALGFAAMWAMLVLFVLFFLHFGMYGPMLWLDLAHRVGACGV